MPLTLSILDETTAGERHSAGAFRFEATRVGRATALAQIVELVKKAQGSKAPVARMAEMTARIAAKLPAELTVSVPGVND